MAVPDLPSNLSLLADATKDAWQLSVNSIITGHTLAGYYTHFRSQQQRAQVYAAMASSGGHLQVRLGVCSGSALNPKVFRLCLCCHEHDVATYGEAFWHRAHHLPGVVVCHVHGEVLVESNVPFRPPGKHVYAACPIERQLSSYRPVVSVLGQPEAARAVAVRSVELLKATWVAELSMPDYREALGLCGIGSGSGGVDRFREAFVAYFGEDLLRASFQARSADKLAWLAEALRTPRRPLHPFKHVLLGLFIEARSRHSHSREATKLEATGKGWPIYQQPEMRKEAAGLARLGLSTYAVAEALDVDWKTAHRLIAPLPEQKTSTTRDMVGERCSWEELAAAHPTLGKKKLRSLAPALYTKLYRHDKAWLLAWQAPQARRHSAAGSVDWNERDCQVEAMVRLQVAMTLQQTPLRRASKNHILGLLGMRPLLAHRAALLPRTTAALNELCETVEDYQLRRVTSVLAKDNRPSLPDWFVLRTARIEPSRFSDRGKVLVHTARRRLGKAASSEDLR